MVGVMQCADPSVLRISSEGGMIEDDKENKGAHIQLDRSVSRHKLQRQVASRNQQAVDASRSILYEAPRQERENVCSKFLNYIFN